MEGSEGSTVEAYVASDCLTIRSKYFGDDVETRHNREGRNREHVDTRKGDIYIFSSMELRFMVHQVLQIWNVIMKKMFGLIVRRLSHILSLYSHLIF